MLVSPDTSVLQAWLMKVSEGALGGPSSTLLTASPLGRVSVIVIGLWSVVLAPLLVMKTW